jgi:hypothetical protein
MAKQELTMELAVSLVERLTTTGHPRFPGAILGTAGMLLDWCRGAFLESVEWSPAMQAGWLIQEAVMWPEGWPERGGPAQLYALFRGKFCPPPPPPNGAVDYGSLPCIRCGSGKRFRDCCYGKPLPEDGLEDLRRKIQ